MLNQCNIMIEMVVIGAAYVVCFIDFFFFSLVQKHARVVNRSRIQILDFNSFRKGN